MIKYKVINVLACTCASFLESTLDQVYYLKEVKPKIS